MYTKPGSESLTPSRGECKSRNPRERTTIVRLHLFMLFLSVVAGLSYMSYLVLLVTREHWTPWALLYAVAFIVFMVLGMCCVNTCSDNTCCVNTWQQQSTPASTEDTAGEGSKLLQHV